MSISAEKGVRSAGRIYDPCHLDRDHPGIGPVGEDVPMEAALGTMAGSKARRSLVVDPDGRLVGVLARDDVVELLVEEVGALGDLIRAPAPR